MKEDTASMIRVDQAGEFGATRIYAGQLAVLGPRHPKTKLIEHMAAQEAEHRATFDRLIAERGVRPTLLTPFWDRAGFALGAVTALISPEAAMACTAAVETEIDRHYEEQRRDLGERDPELSEVIERFQAEELEHKETALAHGAEQAVAYPVMSALIRLGCRAAIGLSKRV
ncbi:MAG: 2-polyprenyl-3-methyl-6-methoxy-1,4-benzoquinol hydroxylase, coq7 type [uncultured Sphingomonadaceae bacterium]|uniref:3-demethoxyubiquinol 3-hydroxylase n=1 Tax=uncultured Sphingomonadaceae bacterium TaxID=169976 RepID=A0A6J4SAG9_9SPHN|nr:MAG: 2-polyprenyl-3-methyl-6-methoxy-1,4-benzoquinol hydroxylase, coq7 type [uncultured Sphingomonadaceae bacterium]